jgi:lipopolysaccharide biosynthesis glycosyltransferase/polysaccharide pyruvyl transferase WcaK-like protein
VTGQEATVPYAFASYVDRNYLRGFEVLVQSLLINNPWIEAPLVVLHSELGPAEIERISALYPRIVFVEVDADRYRGYAKGDQSNYLVEKAYYILDAFRLRGYQRVVTLDVDMVVIGDIHHLVETEAPFAACPQLFDSLDGLRLNSGVMSFDSTFMSDEFEDRIDRIGRDGSYELDRHDQGVLSVALGGEYEHLPREYNLVKRAMPPGEPVPPSTKILHFTGRFKPWHGGEHGYEIPEARWDEYALHVVLYWRRMAAALMDSDLGNFYRARAVRFAALDDDDFADLPACFDRRWAAGDFVGAHAAGMALVLTGDELSPRWFHKLGDAAQATGHLDSARAMYSMAARSAHVAPGALTARARLEWIERDLESARAWLTEALTYDPTLRAARHLKARLDWTDGEDGSTPSGTGPRIGHIAFYADVEGNFGDKVLPQAVRLSLERQWGSTRWSSIHAHQLFDAERASWANANLDALVIGGGGLFLPDTAPNANSGWQWNVTKEALEVLTIPIVIYTVGFNVFRGQQVHGELFFDSIRHLLAKSAFVGLRNHGSISAVSSLAPQGAVAATFAPCATTVYGLLEPGADAVASGAPLIYLNAAFDREDSRFGGAYQEFLSRLADAVREWRKVSEVRCLAHTVADERIAMDLMREHGVSIMVDAVYRDSVPEGLAKISRASVVVGMRGHAGMIPFGLGVPIVSLVSHPKMQYFLDDIAHPEWGVDVTDPALTERLVELVLDMVDRPDHYRRQVVEARGRLDASVAAATQQISEAIGPEHLQPTVP